MFSINYAAMILTVLDNSPYFKRLCNTPELSEISKETLRNNQHFFAMPNDLFELRGKLTLLTNTVKYSTRVNAKRIFAAGALTTLASLALTTAIATGIFGTLSTATFFACTSILLGLAANYHGHIIIKSIQDPALDLLASFKKSVNWTTEFSSRQDLNALHPDCKEAFEEAKEKVNLVRRNLNSVNLREEFKAINFRQIINASRIAEINFTLGCKVN